MKVIEFDGGQGSPSWLEWRKSRVTATDASSIMGLNPWKSPIHLYEEKLGIREPTALNDAMRRGQELEPIARKLFMEETGIEIEPVVIEHSEHSWHGSSLDGYCSANRVIGEIKCPNADAHLLAIQGGIKPYYKCQMQHQFFTSETERGYYISYNPSMDQKLVIIPVYRDETFIKTMFEQERIFYEEHLTAWNPPPSDWTFKFKINTKQVPNMLSKRTHSVVF